MKSSNGENKTREESADSSAVQFALFILPYRSSATNGPAVASADAVATAV
jgi:hypothetical protein